MRPWRTILPGRFLRAKPREALQHRESAPHIGEPAEEARVHLRELEDKVSSCTPVGFVSLLRYRPSVRCHPGKRCQQPTTSPRKGACALSGVLPKKPPLFAARSRIRAFPRLDYPNVSAAMNRRVQFRRSVIPAKAGTILTACYDRNGFPPTRGRRCGRGEAGLKRHGGNIGVIKFRDDDVEMSAETNRTAVVRLTLCGGKNRKRQARSLPLSFATSVWGIYEAALQ